MFNQKSHTMREATSGDKEFVIDLLTKSFWDNKSVNYLIPQDEHRRRRLRELMEFSFETCKLFGKVYVSEDQKGCALVSFPDRKRVSLKSLMLEIKLITRSIGVKNIYKAVKRENGISKNYPSKDIYYLWFIGVSPECQNQGIGTILMRKIILDAGRLNRPIYLETSTIKNLPWYRKFGFSVYNELDFGYKLFMLRKDI